MPDVDLSVFMLSFASGEYLSGMKKGLNLGIPRRLFPSNLGLMIGRIILSDRVTFELFWVD